MTRFLFFSLPLAGHLDWGGMLATAAELTRRPAHQVAWASGPEVAAAVGRAGVEFLELLNTGWSDLPSLPAGFSAENLAILRQQRGLDSWLDLAAILPAAADLQALFADWHPDAIVLEPYAAAAALAAEASKLPIIVCGRPALPDLVQHTALTPASQRIRSLCAQVGVAGRYWDLDRAQIRSPLLHIDYFSRRLVCRFTGHRPAYHVCRLPAAASGGGSARSAHNPHHPRQPVSRRPCLFPHCR